MRHGRKDVMLDLQSMRYAIECMEVADNKITFFGSSVCNGQGAEQEGAEGRIKHGYAWQYGQLLAARHAADTTLPEYEYSNTSNNYTRGDYVAADYGYVKQMNLERHEWDSPTINLLGAVDNCKGDGKWADGYQNGDDIYHPNHAGHTEMMHAIVPSLFDALVAGKAKPARQTGEGVTLTAKQKLEFVPEDTVHAFTLAFRVKNISAMKLALTVKEGTAPQVGSDIADANWHTVAVSHYYAAGKTFVYVDGVQQGEAISGKIVLSKVAISGLCAVSDLSFWRAGMNADEVAAFIAGKMLCSSLELYCPLNEGALTNTAQSTNTISLITDETTAIEQVTPNQIGQTYTILGQPAERSFRGGVVIVTSEDLEKDGRTW